MCCSLIFISSGLRITRMIDTSILHFGDKYWNTYNTLDITCVLWEHPDFLFKTVRYWWHPHQDFRDLRVLPIVRELLEVTQALETCLWSPIKISSAYLQHVREAVNFVDHVFVGNIFLSFHDYLSLLQGHLIHTKAKTTSPKWFFNLGPFLKWSLIVTWFQSSSNWIKDAHLYKTCEIKCYLL